MTSRSAPKASACDSSRRPTFPPPDDRRPYLHVCTMTRQVARDVRPRLLAMTGSIAFMVDDQDFDRLGLHKQWQGVRHGSDRLARGIPSHEDPADFGYRTAWRKHDDRAGRSSRRATPRGQQGQPSPRRFRAGDHHQVRVVCMHPHLAAQVGQRSPLRLRPDSVDDGRCPQIGLCGSALDALELSLVYLDRALHAFTTGERPPAGVTVGSGCINTLIRRAPCSWASMPANSRMPGVSVRPSMKTTISRNSAAPLPMPKGAGSGGDGHRLLVGHRYSSFSSCVFLSRLSEARKWSVNDRELIATSGFRTSVWTGHKAFNVLLQLPPPVEYSCLHCSHR